MCHPTTITNNLVQHVTGGECGTPLVQPYIRCDNRTLQIPQGVEG